MKSKELDQFYTNPIEAKKCFELICQTVDINKFDILLEPSAGTGAFYNLFDKNKRIGLDLDPHFPGLIKQNFFEYNYDSNKKYIIIGNPPFGKNSSLAVKFFNYASEFAEVICFIVPKTFRKQSLINRLDLSFHNIIDIELPKNSFIYNNKPYDVPCCFQIWSREFTLRSKKKILTKHDDFVFVKNYDEADFLVQRVGGKAGAVKTENLQRWSLSSHLLIKSIIEVDTLIDRFKSLPFDDVKFNTAGNPSVAPSELIDLYNTTYNSQK